MSPQLKTLLCLKKTNKYTKTHGTGWEKVFAYHINN